MQYSSNYDVTIPFSDVSVQVALGIGVPQNYVVPGNFSNRYSARFSYTNNSNVFVRLNSAPVTPGAASVTTQPYSEFKPGVDGSQRFVQGGDVIHMITPDATAFVGISLREII